MIQELVFTSARSGLQIGKSGFCTVASTSGMAENLARLLESLSGYRHVIPAGATSAMQNPVVYAHYAMRVGGQPLHVLSRVADAGLDYSNRSNKLAHHIVIPDSEICDGDPIGVMREPDQFITRWDREPEKLRLRTVSGRFLLPAPCTTWQSITGDAGWAGALVESFLARQIAFVIIRPTAPALDLIAEALALLPADDRWRVTFSSYFTNLPPQTECLWRFVLADSAEAAAALRNPSNRVINTTLPLPEASNRYASSARSGATIHPPVFVNPSSEMREIAAIDSNALIATPAESIVTTVSELTVSPPTNSSLRQTKLKVRTTEDVSSAMPVNNHSKQIIWIACFVAIMLPCLVILGVLMLKQDQSNTSTTAAKTAASAWPVEVTKLNSREESRQAPSGETGNASNQFNDLFVFRCAGFVAFVPIKLERLGKVASNATISKDVDKPASGGTSVQLTKNLTPEPMKVKEGQILKTPKSRLSERVKLETNALNYSGSKTMICELLVNVSCPRFLYQVL